MTLQMKYLGFARGIMWFSSWLLLNHFFRVDKEKSSIIPFLSITHNGIVRTRQPHQVTITCSLKIHKFPFDAQTCNISITTFMYTGNLQTILAFWFLLVGLSLLALAIIGARLWTIAMCPFINIDPLKEKMM